MPKLEEAAVLSAADALTIMAEASADMMSVHDPEGTYLFVSPSTTRVTGWRPDELIGQNAFQFFHPKDMAKIEEGHFGIFQVEGGYQVRYRIRCQDGEYRWVETTARVTDSDLIVTCTRRCGLAEPAEASVAESPGAVKRV